MVRWVASLVWVVNGHNRIARQRYLRSLDAYVWKGMQKHLWLERPSYPCHCGMGSLFGMHCLRPQTGGRWKGWFVFWLHLNKLFLNTCDCVCNVVIIPVYVIPSGSAQWNFEPWTQCIGRTLSSLFRSWGGWKWGKELWFRLLHLPSFMQQTIVQ